MLYVGDKTAAKRKREESHEDERSVHRTAGFLTNRLSYGKRRSPLPGVIAAGRLNLDDLCPQVGQRHRTKGTTEHTRQVNDADSVEWLHERPPSLYCASCA